MAPNLTGEEYRFLTKWREEYPRKAEKKVELLTTEDLPFRQKRPKLAIKQKKVEKKVNL